MNRRPRIILFFIVFCSLLAVLLLKCNDGNYVSQFHSTPMRIGQTVNRNASHIETKEDTRRSVATFLRSLFCVGIGIGLFIVILWTCTSLRRCLSRLRGNKQPEVLAKRGDGDEHYEEVYADEANVTENPEQRKPVRRRRRNCGHVRPSPIDEGDEQEDELEAAADDNELESVDDELDNNESDAATRVPLLDDESRKRNQLPFRPDTPPSPGSLSFDGGPIEMQVRVQIEPEPASPKSIKTTTDV